jgi:hypothetical protein
MAWGVGTVYTRRPVNHGNSQKSSAGTPFAAIKVKKGSRPQVLHKIKRLFVIKNRFEAYLIIFALALGAMTRGAHYTEIYPGPMGYVLMAATAGAVFLGGAKILDCLRYERAEKEAAERPEA